MSRSIPVPRRRWTWPVRLVAVGTALVVTAAIGASANAEAKTSPASAFQKLKPQNEKSVPAGTVPKVPPRPADPAAAAALRTTLPAPVWPPPSSSIVDTAVTDDRRAVAGGAVRSGVVTLDRPRKGTAPVPGSVRLDVLDHAAATAAHQPVLLRVGRADGSPSAASVHVSVDYSGFRTAFGADWSTRLRLVQLPECALTTPDVAGCQPMDLASVNSTTGMTVSADVALPAGSAPALNRSGAAAVGQSTVLLAATAGPSGSAGDYTATKLAPSSVWQGGGSSGDFSWSYPMRVPPSLGGPAPAIGLSYSSQSVDGHMAASNNQPSWIGEGFDYGPGSISRGYKGCPDDMGGSANNTVKTGDECWATDNATLSLSGHSGELIRDDATGTWHLKHDDGSRIERFTGAANGDNDGEYWKVTTAEGIQYFFGLNRISGWTSGQPTTNSAWTAPVYGNNPGEPCHQADFASSWCMQAYQWNLDYVVDTHGNTSSYWYTPETNNYARNVNASTVSTYIRGGYLSHIDYGTDNRSGTDSDYTAGHAPTQVRFAVADRCVPGSVCDFAHPGSWPDTPVDQNCASTTSCPNLYSPTFWIQKRLDTVTTSVWNTATNAYRDVDRWTMHQSYPDPGDSTRAGLWLNGISHTGLVGGSASVPDVTSVGVQLANRVDTTTDQSPAMNWWRMSYIVAETGGIIGVTYTAPECVAGSHMPASPDTNTMRCYPSLWTRPGNTTPTIDWFHKYVVHQVTETDTTGGNPRTITTYDYPNPPAWHYSTDDGLVPPSRKTWSVWRGYDKLVTTTGDPGTQTQTVSRYFRGMNGDHLPSGTRSVSIDGIADDDAFAGMARESLVLNGPGGAEVTESTSTPWESTPTSTRTAGGFTVAARHTGTAVAKTRTDLDGGRAARTSTVTTTFDNTFGYPTQIADGGDDATTTDDRCATTTYVNNTTAWIIGEPARATSYALPCGQTPTSQDDVVSDNRTAYDGQAFGAAPVRGDVTETDTAKAWSSPTNVTWLVLSKAAADPYGRVADTWDVRGNHSTVAFTPASGAPVTSVTKTNAFGWSATTAMEPAWGVSLGGTDVNGVRTDVTYDPLGRLTAVWEPGRNKANGDGPTRSYTYTLSKSGITSVATTKLTPTGGYQTAYQLYDSLLRARQTQGPAANGSGRVITDTFYNSAGQQVKTNAPYYNTDSGPGTTLFTAQDNQVPNQTITVYDGAGRATASVLMAESVEQWRTSTSFGGDHVDVTPPAGGIATSAVTDGRGNRVELRQFHNGTTSGAYDATAYTYDRKGQLVKMTDVAGNLWTWTYDLRGNVIAKTDPDAGSSITTYSDAEDVLTRTDGRNKTLAYSYDALGRQRGEFDTSTSGTQLAGWTYDTAPLLDNGAPTKGQLASSTRYVAGNAYTTTVRGYTNRYSSTGQIVSIPMSEGPLAGTYTSTIGYNADGSLNSTHYPAAGGLGGETVNITYDPSTSVATQLKTNYGGALDGTYVTGQEYTPFGEPAVTTYSTGGKLAQQGLYYDPTTRRLGEALTVKETAPSTVADVHYTYDKAGNVTKIADTPAGGTADTQCFTNDYLRRLTAAWTPANGDCSATPTVAGLGGPAPYWQSWNLDTVGNRLSQTDRSVAGTSTTTYTEPGAGANQAHALSSTSTVDGSGTHSTSYSYDQTGNTLKRTGPSGQQTLTWDIEGRLATVTDTTGTSSYLYDTDGSRLISRDPTGTTLNLGSMELRLNKSNNVVTATRYYSFVGGIVAVRTGAGVTWLASDHHGTADVAIDANTQAVTQRRFKPYGESRSGSTTWVNDKGYLGGTTDATGLVHLGAREYDPTTGRFLSSDPILETNDPQQIHGYIYSADSPVTMADPSGLEHDEEGCGEVCQNNGGHQPGYVPPIAQGGTLVDTGQRKGSHYGRLGSAWVKVNGQDHWTIRYYVTPDGLLVGVSDGGCPEGGPANVCASRSWVIVYGQAAPCMKGNEGSACFYGKDGLVWDPYGNHSCLKPGENGPAQCSEPNSKPAPVNKDCKPPAPKPTRPLQFSSARRPKTCETNGGPLPADCVSFTAELLTNAGLRSDKLPAAAMAVTAVCLFTGPVGCGIATGISLLIDVPHVLAVSSDPRTGEINWGKFAAYESIDVLVAGAGWMFAGGGGYLIEKEGMENFIMPMRYAGVGVGVGGSSGVMLLEDEADESGGEG
jgi:RHS repeat-associated protein